MLEYLLVLGQVPGTKLQITFLEIVLAVYLPMLARIWSRREQIAKMDWQYFKLVYLRRQANRELAMMGLKPAISTRRIALVPRVHTFQRPRWPRERQVHRVF